MTAQHTPGKSLEQLAKAAQMMPWDKSQSDVPFDARYAFSKAITADHYLELLEALRRVLDCCDISECRTVPNSPGALKNARAAIARATHKEQT